MRRDPLDDAAALVPRVYAYVAYRVGDGADAEDVTSAVFERALRYRDSWDRSRGEPIAWLIGIARRCIEDARDDRRTVPLHDIELAAPTNLEETAADRLALADALASLSPRERELVALRYGADLSTRQIAAALDSSPAAVRVALHRALTRLRWLLTDPPQPEPLPLRAALAGSEEAT